MRHRQLAVRDTVLHVAEIGDGPPVLLLHGWPEFWATWLPLINRLHGDFRLIAPDLRGFGDSAKAAAPRSDVGANCHADDMAALLHALDLDSVGVVGHDVGAYAAQALARRHPQAVERLLFFNCPTASVGGRWVHDGHVNEVWYQAFQQLGLAEALVGSSREACSLYLGHFLTHWCHRKDAFEPAFESWVDNFMKPGNLRGGFDWYRSQNALRLAAIDGHAPPSVRIHQPTRVHWGRHDPILKSEWAAFVPEHFDEAKVTFCESAGHFVHVEAPDEAAQVFVDVFG
ncbi:alpha/beta hydrolase [Bosea vaviloviae]|uniref:Alpha/beta hydrolase n=1 Tax=Bosea vaviloviae TaxID=1526658 RepID=A0A1D7U9Q9_9HYPH|nr:alpha/beta hydrolase [Bosea vaviloviae]